MVAETMVVPAGLDHNRRHELVHELLYEFVDVNRPHSPPSAWSARSKPRSSQARAGRDRFPDGRLGRLSYGLALCSRTVWRTSRDPCGIRGYCFSRS